MRNCKKEFEYAMDMKKGFCIPVIMDNEAMDKDKWYNKLFFLKKLMHADLTSDNKTAFEAGVDAIVHEMVARRPELKDKLG
jgi:hypothetical protein